MAQYFQRLHISQPSWFRIYSSGPSCTSFNPKCMTSGTLIHRSDSKMIHMSSASVYMMVKHIPLPENVEDIDSSEKLQFSPQRTRDISGPVILSKTMGTFINNEFATGYNCRSQPSDPHFGIYDTRGPVSLHSAMQTNVPEPFAPKGKATHLNMPGGQWGQGYKYISDDLQNFHYRNMAQQFTAGTYFTSQKLSSLTLLGGKIQLESRFPFSSEAKHLKRLTTREKFKNLIKDYGSTVIVFHVGISLLSLCGFYLLVSSGISMETLENFLKSLGIEGVLKKGGTFVIAYAIHKVFAPARLAVTAVASPFIVRYLRRKGVLKTP